MNNAMFHEIIEQNLAEKFWNELNEEANFHVEFVDAAVSFTALRQLTKEDSIVDIAQA